MYFMYFNILRLPNLLTQPSLPSVCAKHLRGPAVGQNPLTQSPTGCGASPVAPDAVKKGSPGRPSGSEWRSVTLLFTLEIVWLLALWLFATHCHCPQRQCERVCSSKSKI